MFSQKVYYLLTYLVSVSRWIKSLIQYCFMLYLQVLLSRIYVTVLITHFSQQATNISDLTIKFHFKDFSFLTLTITW